MQEQEPTYTEALVAAAECLRLAEDSKERDRTADHVSVARAWLEMADVMVRQRAVL